MKKIVSIYSAKFLGHYCYAQSNERIPAEVPFLFGVFLTVVLPQIICIVYGGIIPLVAFASVATVGCVLGWVLYRQMPYHVTSCFSTRNMPQAPPSEDHIDVEAA